MSVDLVKRSAKLCGRPCCFCCERTDGPVGQHPPIVACQSNVGGFRCSPPNVFYPHASPGLREDSESHGGLTVDSSPGKVVNSQLLKFMFIT
ncbi:Hypothetical protein NTJ_08747 [Nesidiocoris tenuis]|uniref:Uncharacterized protein n=1 Tax=Nesidiocoris tenuis TaxID=355587 RepID=A0ABN7AUS7_9HEMI|nr:Hypothetical protein NTJ_08747 [Nesidiocoris tenuis]